MIRESVGWLETVLIGAQNARWCTRPFCTTCGCLEFKRAYWAAAAQEAGIDSRFDTAHHPSEILTGVSAVDRETMVRTLVTGLRALPPGWTDTDAFRIIIIDLYPPLIKHGIPMVLDAELSGTPAGEAFGRMRAHYAEVIEHRNRRKAYESPHAVEERKRVRREKRAIAHGNRQSISRQRNAKRLELLAELARLPPVERLSRFATNPELKLDCVSTELIPAQERDLIDLEKANAVALIARIGRRKGPWGRLRRILEHLVDASY